MDGTCTSHKRRVLPAQKPNAARACVFCCKNTIERLLPLRDHFLKHILLQSDSQQPVHQGTEGLPCEGRLELFPHRSVLAGSLFARLSSSRRGRHILGRQKRASVGLIHNNCSCPLRRRERALPLPGSSSRRAQKQYTHKLVSGYIISGCGVVTR